VSEPDLGRLDELELLDVSGEEDFAEAIDAFEIATADDGTAASPLRRLAGAAGAAVARLVAPVVGLAAPVAAPLGRVGGSFAGATTQIASRVPAAVLAGAAGFAGVLVVTLIGATLLGGGRPAEASAVRGPAPSGPSGAAPLEPSRRPDPPLTPTAAGATPTPMPTTFERQGEGWRAIARFSPEPRQVMPAERLLLFDDERETFTITTKTSVLLRSGPLAPWWGILLSYQGEQDHVRLEFFTDSYDRNRPYVGLLTTKNGPSKSIGPTVRLPGIDFWGRDRYELRVVVDRGDVTLWLDGKPVHTWKVPGGLAGRKGLYVWGSSRMQFDAFSIE
jgi:hypothetical protein